MKNTILIISIILGTVLLIGGFTLGIIGMEKKTCLEAYSNYQPQWNFWSSCRVMWNGKLTPVKIVREIK